jgi:hypothetical protein
MYKRIYNYTNLSKIVKTKFKLFLSFLFIHFMYFCSINYIVFSI